jgi:hypothetical protein
MAIFNSYVKLPEASLEKNQKTTPAILDSLYSGAQGDQNRCVLNHHPIIHNALIIVSLRKDGLSSAF